MATGRDRIRAALKRSCADRIPVGLILGPFRAAIEGCSCGEYFRDPQKLADSTLAAYGLFQHDSVEVTWDILLEAEAAGAELEFPEDGIPRVRRHVLSSKQDLFSLRLPRAESSGRYPAYLEACVKVARSLQGVALSGTVTGPWTIAAGLRGAQDLIYDTVDDPSFVEDLMGFTSEAAKILGTGLLGCGLSLTLGEAACSCSLISPAIYRRFIKPRHQEIVRFFREKKAGLSMHICGFIDPLMEDLMDLGIVALSLDSPSSLEKMVKVSGKRIVLVGNVSTSLFVGGSREGIERAVQECILSAAPGGAFVLSSGCELPYNATADRVKFFMEAAGKYGRPEWFLAR